MNVWLACHGVPGKTNNYYAWQRQGKNNIYFLLSADCLNNIQLIIWYGFNNTILFP